MANTVDPSSRDKYLLEVTSGPTYTASTHQIVPVNTPHPTLITSPLASTYLQVRIKNYHGLPLSSPPSSPYFTHPTHTSDLYSIAFSFVPARSIPGTDLVMGFDYDHSIKHQLPPGFKYAMKIATSMLDPGLYSDAYSDEPYLYGPALSSFFAFRVGEKVECVSAAEQLRSLEGGEGGGGVVLEGADGSGKAVRDQAGVPGSWKKRRKHFLDAKALEGFTFEKGRMYHADFFNSHLDFAEFALRLPGFSIRVAKYIDEKTHHLRFVMKDRRTGEVIFVVFFKLLFGRELEDKLRDEKDGGQIQKAPLAARLGIPDGEEKTESKKTGTLQTVGADVQPGSSTAEPDGGNEGIAATATTAANSLANSIYAVCSALGFGNSSSSSKSEPASRSPSPQPSSKAVAAQIDEMDDAIVERYLQSRNGSVK